MNSSESRGRSVRRLVGGTAVGQVLLFAASLVVVRLYSPAEFGVFVTASAVAATLMPLATGRFDFAIPLAKLDADGLRVARLAVLSVAVWSVLIALALFFTNEIEFVGIPDEWANLRWAIPALTISAALLQIGNQLAVRAEKYSAISVRAMVYPAVTGFAQIAFGIGGAGTEGLIAGVVIGQTTAFLTLWIPARRAIESTPAEASESSSLRALASQYRAFPLVLSWAGWLNTLTTQLPLMVVSAVYGFHAAGQVGIALRVLALPVALVGQSLGYVYTGEISRYARNATAAVGATFDQVSRKLILAGTTVALVVSATSWWVLPLVLGKDWNDAGIYASIFGIAIGSQLVAAPVSQTLTVAQRVWSQTALDFGRVTSILCVGLAAAMFDLSVVAATCCLSGVMAAGYVFVWWQNRSAARALDTDVNRDRKLIEGDRRGRNR